MALLLRESASPYLRGLERIIILEVIVTAEKRKNKSKYTQEVIMHQCMFVGYFSYNIFSSE